METSKPKNGSERRAKRASVLVSATVATALLTSAAVVVQESGPALLEGARSVLQEYVATQRLISQEKRDWALGKEVVNDQIELVRQEIASLREQIAEDESKITEADKERVKLLDEKERLAQASAGLKEAVADLEVRTKALVAKLPDPVREQVMVLSQRLPEDPAAEDELALTERFPNVVGILNEVNRFQRDVTITSEVRELQGGEKVEVTALYVGIGQAYYVSAAGDAAGIGTATADGWTWTPANDAAASIKNLMGILNEGLPAAFVQVPTRVE